MRTKPNIYHICALTSQTVSFANIPTCSIAHCVYNTILCVSQGTALYKATYFVKMTFTKAENYLPYHFIIWVKNNIVPSLRSKITDYIIYLTERWILYKAPVITNMSQIAYALLNPPGSRLTMAYDATIEIYRKLHRKTTVSKMLILRCMGS